MAIEDIKLYTVEEVVDLLQTTRRTVYRYIKDGKLQAVKVGRTWRITDTALKDFLNVK